MRVTTSDDVGEAALAYVADRDLYHLAVRLLCISAVIMTAEPVRSDPTNRHRTGVPALTHSEGQHGTLVSWKGEISDLAAVFCIQGHTV